MSNDKVEEAKKELKDRFHIGFDNQQKPRHLYIQIPIGVYADNREDGFKLFYGACKEFELKGAKVLNALRAELYRSKVIKPGTIGADGKPITVQ